MGKTGATSSSRLRFVPPFVKRHREASKQWLSNVSRSMVMSSCYDDQVPGDIVECLQGTPALSTDGVHPCSHGNSEKTAGKACKKAVRISKREDNQLDRASRTVQHHAHFLRAVDRLRAELSEIRKRQQLLNTGQDREERCATTRIVTYGGDAASMTSGQRGKLVSTRDQTRRTELLTRRL